MAMEFERLNLFHNKCGKSEKEIWSNDIPEAVTTFKPRSFKGEMYYQYTLSPVGKEYHRTQAEFVLMNPEENFLIARFFKIKSYKCSKM